MSFAPLVREYRGDTLDLTHFGYLVIVDEHSKVLYSVGDPDDIVFYRSASKPIQALPVIARGLDKKYGITEEESVIFAGSHAGEPYHIAALESILAKTGLTEDMLVMKPAVPAYAPANEARIRAGIPPRKLFHNCAGKHCALMLLQRNCTVTICHSRTADLRSHTRRADILISAIGKPGFVTADMVKTGAAVIDVGINRVDGKVCGDVDYAAVQEIAGWLTPVPGGVGPMTIAMLLMNTLEAAERSLNE